MHGFLRSHASILANLDSSGETLFFLLTLWGSFKTAIFPRIRRRTRLFAMAMVAFECSSAVRAHLSR